MSEINPVGNKDCRTIDICISKREFSEAVKDYNRKNPNAQVEFKNIYPNAEGFNEEFGTNEYNENHLSIRSRDSALPTELYIHYIDEKDQTCQTLPVTSCDPKAKEIGGILIQYLLKH